MVWFFLELPEMFKGGFEVLDCVGGEDFCNQESGDIAYSSDRP